MYDHIKRGWLAVELTAMGCLFVGFTLSLFMLGERPLGLRFFQRKKILDEESSEKSLA